MLASLGHHAFVRRNYEKHEINAARTGEHVFDKPLMARYVNESKTNIRDLHFGKTEIDRDPSLFLFGQPVSINARQRLYQSRFSMVDVPRCSCDYVHICG
jgi:hypothetical protein